MARAKRARRTRRTASCKYGKLKSPHRDPKTGRMRRCKKGTRR